MSLIFGLTVGSKYEISAFLDRLPYLGCEKIWLIFLRTCGFITVRPLIFIEKYVDADPGIYTNIYIYSCDENRTLEIG